MMGEKPVIFWMDWIKVLSLRMVIMNTDLLEKDVVSSDSSDYIYEQSGFMSVPEGYREFRDLYAYEKVNKNDSTQWHITVDDTLTFMIDVEQLPSTDSISPYLLPELNGKGVLSVSELEIRKIWNDSLESNLSLRGYLFR